MTYNKRNFYSIQIFLYHHYVLVTEIIEYSGGFLCNQLQTVPRGLKFVRYNIGDIRGPRGDYREIYSINYNFNNLIVRLIFRIIKTMVSLLSQFHSNDQV